LMHAGPSAAQEVTLRAVTAFAEGTQFSKNFERFIEKVNADGKGVVRINYIGGPRAMPPFEVGNAVRTKVVDIANVTGAFYTNLMPEADGFKLIAKPMPKDSDFRVGFLGYADVVAKWESGGGGMVTTMPDFAKFTQMILDGGKFQGKQIISPKSFELMTSDHIGRGSGVQRDFFYFPGDGFGFGLGFGVRTDAGNAKPPPPGSLGELKWDGASGCYFVVDRKQDMFFVLLQQTPSERQRIQKTVKQLIYEAMEN